MGKYGNKNVDLTPPLPAMHPLIICFIFQMNDKKKRCQYTGESMSLALHAVREGMSKKKAAKLYGVPRTTLLDKLAGRVPEVSRAGPCNILTPAEEQQLVDYVTLMSSIGYPITRLELSNEVRRIMDADGRQTPIQEQHPRY